MSNYGRNIIWWILAEFWRTEPIVWTYPKRMLIVLPFPASSWVLASPDPTPPAYCYNQQRAHLQCWALNYNYLPTSSAGASLLALYGASLPSHPLHGWPDHGIDPTVALSSGCSGHYGHQHPNHDHQISLSCLLSTTTVMLAMKWDTSWATTLMALGHSLLDLYLW